MNTRNVGMFIELAQLLNVIRALIVLQPSKCEECGKAFTVNHELTQHQKIHHCWESYACKEGGQDFVWKFY